MSSAPGNDRQAKIAAATGKPRSNSRAILAAVVGALVVLGIVLALWLPNRGGGNSGGTSTPSGSSSGSQSGTVALPKTVKDANSPIIATNGGVLKDGIPTLQVFEDFQCPICKQAESIFGSRIAQLGQSGQINVVYYVKTFMDDNLRNNWSTTVGNAAACAADQGKFEAYHDKIYPMQPATEGEGYTDAKVQSAATEAGLSGAALDTWKQCVSKNTYDAYLKGIETYTSDAMHVTGTPGFYVNGKEIPLSGIQTADDFQKALFATAK